MLKGYQESGLVVVLFGAGQALSDELRFNIHTSYHNLHLRLQVENTTICLKQLQTYQFVYTVKEK